MGGGSERRTEELLKITSQSCVSYLLSFHRPAAREGVPLSAGTHSRKPHPPQQRHRLGRYRSYPAQSSRAASAVLRRGAKRTLEARPELRHCGRFPLRMMALPLDPQPPRPPLTLPSSLPTLAERASERSAQRPKGEIKRKFGGFHSASVFSTRSQSRFILAGQPKATGGVKLDGSRTWSLGTAAARKTFFPRPSQWCKVNHTQVIAGEPPLKSHRGG